MNDGLSQMRRLMKSTNIWTAPGRHGTVVKITQISTR